MAKSQTKAKSTKASTYTNITYGLSVARILLGWLFLWSFLDKLLGLYATPVERAWVNGGSPTRGFLLGVEGPFAPSFHSLAGQAWVDWAYMIGMICVGTALIFGVAVRLAAITGSVLLLKFWAASLPLESNPVVDENIIYLALLVNIGLMPEQKLSATALWQRLPIVRQTRWLQ